MEKKVVDLAARLFSLPEDDQAELMKILQYYSRFGASQRVRAMKLGAAKPDNEALEREVQTLMERAAGSQDVYMQSTSAVCPLCGK